VTTTTPYRIIQWGTGNVGLHALRTIVERPDFELVGLRVYNPDKVGTDAGDLLDVAATGVVATDSTDAIVATDADCVSYTPLGSTLDDSEGALQDICALLVSGKNVVSSAVEYHAFLRPGRELPGPADAYDRLVAACDAGGTSFFHAGINPGYAMEVWPLTLSQVCRRIDRMTVTEVIDMRRYPSLHMLEYMGFGAPGTESPMDHRMARGFKLSPYYLALCTLAEALGVELDDVQYHREAALAEESFAVAAGTIEAGTAAAIKFGFDGFVHGTPRIVFEWVWRVSDDVAPEWPTGASRWIVRIEGDPTVEASLDLATTFDAGRAVSLSVATIVLNAVPAVCAAPPGLYNNLTIGLHGGGYFLP
jgi:4-hydroxy-tetrahydrodipicolinate reductase